MSNFIRKSAILLLPLLVACSASGAKSPVATGSLPQASTTPTSTLPPYNPTIDPASFTSAITNRFFPLKPGTTYIYEGTRDGVPRRAEMTVTKETKTILGVKCVVVRDVLTSNNQLVEKTADWYAQDKAGDVWYFGEDTKEYTNGSVSSTAGTWLAGVDGALPGVIMHATPVAGEGYRQEYRPGQAEDYAKVVQLGASVSTPSGRYINVVVTEDTDLLDKTKFEHKYYAPNVGFVMSTGTVNGHKEVTKLSSILKG